MLNLILQNKAQEALNYAKKYEKHDFDMIISVLKELEVNGRNWDKMKDIGSGIKRIRVGRWRILCTLENNIYVWIIALEKDTKKDYDRWKEYIMQQLK